MSLSEEHISQLIMEKILETISPEDDALLQEMINHHQAVRLQYEHTLKMMEEAKANNIFPPDTDKSWQQVDAILTKRKTIKLRRTILRVAAVIIFFLLLGGGVFFLNNIHHRRDQLFVKGELVLKLANGKTITLSGSPNAISVNGITIKNDSSNRVLQYQPIAGQRANNQINTLIVPPSLDYKIALSDGTIVTLNSATKLSFPFAFTGSTREISIDGEAYLQVAHNASKPFIVHLPGSTVRVLGTQFNVNTYNKADIKVSLVKGSLRFSSKNDSILIVPGKEAVLKNQTLKEQDLNKDDLAWIDGKYIMNNTSLNAIAALIPRWYGVKVLLDDHAIADKRFSGIIYKNRPLSDFLEMLRGTTDANFYYSGDVLHFK